jgi:hypothetical protein
MSSRLTGNAAQKGDEEPDAARQQRAQRQRVAEEGEHDRQRNECEVAQLSAVAITRPSTSPIAHPVRQCPVAVRASRLSEA